MKLVKIRLFGVGVAGFALLGVAASPMTGWIVRQQVTASVCGILPISEIAAMNPQSRQRETAAAAAKPVMDQSTRRR